MTTTLAETLLAWYEANKRDLPWRRTRDPYAIWVSEVMLQQTQVETVVPYFERWMSAFPTLRALAAADIDDVLNLWEGLGYYRRAHGLYRAAQQLVESGADTLPHTIPELEALPGIGPYTARAVAAIAFGADVLALDGNLRRVLARIFNVDLDLATAEGERRIRELGESVLPKGKASAFNQALMDLGATVCVARGARCSACPLSGLCAAFSTGVQEQRPVQGGRRTRPHRSQVQVALRRGDRVLVGRRAQGGLLGGLWAFPETPLGSGEPPDEAAQRMVQEELAMPLVDLRALGAVEHAYTHFSLTSHAFACDVGEGTPQSDVLDELSWVGVGQLSDLAMGKVDRAIAQLLARS